LDAEKRLALQEEKQSLETKLLTVYVGLVLVLSLNETDFTQHFRPKMRERLAELKSLT